MIDPVTCPHCREQLDIPGDLRGRPVRCANCQNVFTPSALNATPAIPQRLPQDSPPWRDREPRPSRRDDFDTRPHRQSNGGVWGLLVVTTLLLGGCGAGCIGIGVWAYNPKMQVYTSIEGKFRIEFPGDPSPNVGSGEKGDGSVTVIGQRAENQEKYVVKSYPLPTKYRALTDDEKLSELVKLELAAEAAGTETRRETTTHDGFPALDVMASTAGGIINRRNTIMRCVLVGTRVYVVYAQGPNMEPQVWWVRKYFTSFTVTDPSAKSKLKQKEDGKPQKQD